MTKALAMLVALAALWPDAAMATTMTVHVPAKMADLSRKETVRLAVDVDLVLVEYGADGRVTRDTEEVIVILKDDAPAEWRSEKHPNYGAVAAADSERRIAFVFMKDLERALRLNRGDPLFRIALGRVVAHELEHLRRGKPGHDETGWFRACPRPEELTELGWGPRKAEGRR